MGACPFPPEDFAAPKVVNNAAYDRYTGSCLKLYKNSDPAVFIYYDQATSTRSFPVLARSYCGYQGSGGRLVSFNSLNSSANALLTAIKTLVTGASTNLVLVGGFQSTNLKNGVFAKNTNWIWTDAYTSPSIIANGNWAPGQPEYVRGRGRGAGMCGRPKTMGSFCCCFSLPPTQLPFFNRSKGLGKGGGRHA